MLTGKNIIIMIAILLGIIFIGSKNSNPYIEKINWIKRYEILVMSSSAKTSLFGSQRQFCVYKLAGNKYFGEICENIPKISTKKTQLKKIPRNIAFGSFMLSKKLKDLSTSIKVFLF